MADEPASFLFPVMSLDPGMVENLRRFNPWWEGLPGLKLPPHRRTVVDAIHKRLRQRLAPIVTVRGAVQVGKTTAQLQVIDDLLKAGVPGRNILRVQCDEIPTLAKLKEPILLADGLVGKEHPQEDAEPSGRPGRGDLPVLGRSAEPQGLGASAQAPGR